MMTCREKTKLEVKEGAKGPDMIPILPTFRHQKKSCKLEIGTWQTAPHKLFGAWTSLRPRVSPTQSSFTGIIIESF